MPKNTYECLVLFDTNKVSGNVDGARDALLTLLQKHHSEILAHRVWDEKRLAYPIGNQKKGTYYLVYFATDSENMMPMEEDFRLSEVVLRHMTIRLHEKWIEPSLEVARDERATCLRLMGDDLDDSATRHTPRSGPAAVAITEEPAAATQPTATQPTPAEDEGGDVATAESPESPKSPEEVE